MPSRVTNVPPRPEVEYPLTPAGLPNKHYDPLNPLHYKPRPVVGMPMVQGESYGEYLTRLRNTL